MVVTIKSFFSSGELLKMTNSTTIVLVPKIPNPDNVGDYRPISCCNTIFLSQEILRGYHRVSRDPRCAMKIDIMKAYDNVRWDILFDILEAMGFPIIFIRWVRACVTSPSYFICINGNLNGYFMGKKGLRLLVCNCDGNVGQNPS